MRLPRSARFIQTLRCVAALAAAESHTLLLALLVGLLAPGAAAQDVRPGDERPELPEFEPPDEEGRRPPVLPLPELPPFEPPRRERGTVLPPLELPQGLDTEGLEGGVRAYVRRIEVSGNTALPEREIREIAYPYAGRELSFADLERLRDELTLAYIRRGYVTSGAVIPTQSLSDGVLEVWIVEGGLAQIQVETDGRLRAGYVRKRIELAAAAPLNVHQLEERLQLLQQDARIRAVHASLVPGERRGEAVLRVRVAEASPWRIRFGGNNYSSPALGGARGQVLAGYRNITGWGDSLSAEYKGGEGLHDVWASYEVPLTAWDTSFELHMRRTWSEVVEAPFDVLDITSETATYGFTLRQPLHRSVSTRVEAFLIGEYRKSESFLLGEPFSFVIGPIQGVGEETVLRFGASWSHGSRTQALALRSMLSVGLDVLGATHHEGEIPDGQFLAWLGQAQWARRFPSLWNLQLLARADVQIADRPLLGLEQFAIGGHATVRGYRENQLVRDNGLVGSLELRVPLPMPGWREWHPRFELAPFVDAGYSWNAGRSSVGPQTLVSVGLGGRLALSDRLHFQAYWGHRLKDVPEVGGKSLQDDGLHLGLAWGW
jgi:hemolysin activation/secretion protein